MSALYNFRTGGFLFTRPHGTYSILGDWLFNQESFFAFALLEAKLYYIFFK